MPRSNIITTDLEKVLKNAIRAELTSGNKDVSKLLETIVDIHSTFQWEHFLEQGADAHFLCRFLVLDGNQSLGKASDYWKQVDYKYPFEGTFTLPSNKKAISIYSRRAFIYPQLFVNAKLPLLSFIGDETSLNYFLGLEHGSNVFNGIASFLLQKTSTVDNQLYVVVGSLNGTSNFSIDVAKPSDFNVAYHKYRVVLTKNLVLFFIDSRIRAIAVQSLQGSTIAVKTNVLPYSIVLIPPIPSSLTSLLEINTNRTSIAQSDLSIPLSPYNYRVSDGKDIIPLSLPLYLENLDTVLAGYSIGSGSVTSHPIPVFGYPNKTLFFQANQSGTLTLEVYTLAGNWRTYDTDTVSADTLWRYKMTGDAVLARLTFTPLTYPCTVSEGEVVLNG
jgi:hypothetical protein